MVDLNRTDIVDNGLNIEDAPESIRKQAEFIAAYEAQFEPDNKENQPEEQESQEAPVSQAKTQEAPLTPDKAVVQDKTDDEEYKKLEQKYRSLQGMFNSQGKQIQNLTAKLEETLTRLETKPEPPKEAPKPREKRVTEKDRENLGDLDETITRYAQDAAETIIAQKETEWTKIQSDLEKRNARLEAQLQDLNKKQVDSVENQFRAQLIDAIPNFVAQDSDEDFIAWLDEEDQNSGLAYKQILGNAYHQRNVARIKRLYTSWQELSGKYTEQPKVVSRDVQKQVQPTRTRAAAPRLPTTTHNKIWSEKEVGEFYQVNREALMHNDPEVMKIANEIDKAVNEGRVR